MRFGFIGSFGSPQQQVRLARECEEHGWDGFFTWDGVSLAEPGFDVVPTWDPFALLGAVAAVTDRITLGAVVFAPPRRRPWELAQQILTVDHLSGGRLVLPVGVGVPNDRAFTSVPGQPTSLRDLAHALDEVLDWLQRSWSGELFEHDGEWAATGPFQLPQTPVNGRVPVWPVAVWDAQQPPLRSLQRALRWDGMVVQVRGGETPEDAEPDADDLRSLTAWLAEQRGPDAPPFDVVHQGRLDPDPDVARRQAAEAAEAGATWWMESWWDPATTPESLFDRVRQGPPTI
jgi:hypothetical protein